MKSDTKQWGRGPAAEYGWDALGGSGYAAGPLPHCYASLFTIDILHFESITTLGNVTTLSVPSSPTAATPK